jgi:hypothetical protein
VQARGALEGRLRSIDSRMGAVAQEVAALRPTRDLVDALEERLGGVVAEDEEVEAEEEEAMTLQREGGDGATSAGGSEGAVLWWEDWERGGGWQGARVSVKPAGPTHLFKSSTLCPS